MSPLAVLNAGSTSSATEKSGGSSQTSRNLQPHWSTARNLVCRVLEALEVPGLAEDRNPGNGSRISVRREPPNTASLSNSTPIPCVCKYHNLLARQADLDSP